MSDTRAEMITLSAGNVRNGEAVVQLSQIRKRIMDRCSRGDDTADATYEFLRDQYLPHFYVGRLPGAKKHAVVFFFDRSRQAKVDLLRDMDVLKAFVYGGAEFKDIATTLLAAPVKK